MFLYDRIDTKRFSSLLFGLSKLYSLHFVVHERAEEYIYFASNLMLFPTNNLGSYGFDASKRQYPLETLSALAYLESPLRRPSVIETWAPYEVAVFEGAIALHGKDFYEIHKHIGTKSTKEVIDFYYVWKKTSHYNAWKESYIPPELDISPEEARKGSSGK